MEKNVNVIGLLYLFLITGFILWFCITRTRIFNDQIKEIQVKANTVEKIEKENAVLIQENTLLKKENRELKEQLEFHNKINFSILNSIIDGYSSLKEENNNLKKQNEDTEKELNKVKDSTKHIIMKIEKTN